MSKYSTPKELFTAICDSIRDKTGETELINHEDIPEKIASIEKGMNSDYYSLLTYATNLKFNKNSGFTFVPSLNLPYITDFSYMFYNQNNIIKVDSILALNGTNFSNMFDSCGQLEQISNLYAPNGLDFSHLLRACSSLKEVSNIITDSGKDFSYMFSNCLNLTRVPLFNTANGENFSHMFDSCTNIIEIPKFNTFNGVYFNDMFSECLKLSKIPELDTHNGKYFSLMFYQCRQLTDIPKLDTSNGTNFEFMFYNCYNLESICELDLSNAEDRKLNSMFSNCSKLTNISFKEKSIKQPISFQNSPNLSSDSIESIINGLAEIEETASKPYIIFNSAIQLSDKQTATIGGKNWTISYYR